VSPEFLSIDIAKGTVMRTKDLIAEATSLPVEERAIVADLILKSLTPADSKVDEKWKAIALQRVEEINSGKVDLVSGTKVFERIQERFDDEIFLPPCC